MAPDVVYVPECIAQADGAVDIDLVFPHSSAHSSMKVASG
jgi:hypothetical protein